MAPARYSGSGRRVHSPIQTGSVTPTIRRLPGVPSVAPARPSLRPQAEAHRPALRQSRRAASIVVAEAPRPEPALARRQRRAVEPAVPPAATPVGIPHGQPPALVLGVRPRLAPPQLRQRPLGRARAPLQGRTAR